MTAHEKLERLERELFHFTKAQTIALSVAIILALALAGLLAGTLLKQPATELEVQPGENGEMVGATSVKRPVAAADLDVAGNGMVLASSFTKDLAKARKLRAQTLAPEPVGSPTPGASPAASPTPGASPTPATSPTPVTSPTPTPAPVPPPAGTGIDLSGIVTIPTPAPWTATYSDATQASLNDGRNNWAFGIVGKADPATDAAGMMPNLFTNLVVNQQQMSQLAMTDPEPIQPFGSMTSAAVMAYRGLWTDTQGSFMLEGRLWVGVRQDGMAYVMTAETTPPEDFLPSEPEWGEVVNGAYRSFAGVQ